MNDTELQRLQRQATNLRNSGQVDEAIEIYEHLATAYTLNGDTTKAASIVQQIGIANKTANRTERSLEKLSEAKDMYEEAGDPVGAGRALREIAVTHAYVGDYDAATPILMQSIVHLRDTDATDELALSELELGINYLRQNDIISANEWVATGWSKLETSDNWLYKMIAIYYRSELAYAELDHAMCEDLCEEAITLIRSHGEEKDQKHYLAKLYGLLALSKLARQEMSAEEVDLSRYYLSQLDNESQHYLTTKTLLKDLPTAEGI